jgi:hypothetical protein
MAQLPRNFLGGMLAADQIAQQRQASELQQVMGLASVLRQQQAAQQEAQLAPLRMQMLQTQLQGAQQEATQNQEAHGLLGKLYGDFRASQTPKEYPSEDGVPQVRTELPSFDAQRQLFTGMLQNPKTAQMGIQGLTRLDAMQAQGQERQAAREQRMQEIHLRLQDARLAREDRAALQREMAHLAASLRPPRQEPAPTIVQTDTGPMQVDREGNARPITGPDGKPVSAKKTGTGHLTEGEAKGTLFYRQMKSANDQLEKVVGSGFSDKELPGQIAMRMARSDWTNWLAPAKAQQYAQATEQWAEAYLRLKTGAATNRDEIIRNARTYFPQPGDSPEVIRQKADMRRQAESDVSVVAGRGIDATQKEQPKQAPSIDDLLRKYGG